MLILPGYPNPADPAGPPYAAAVAIPADVTIQNLARQIIIRMHIWASVEALAMGAPPIGEHTATVDGEKYYEMVNDNPDNAAAFLQVAQAIDTEFLAAGTWAGALQGPVTLPERP